MEAGAPYRRGSLALVLSQCVAVRCMKEELFVVAGGPV
jgi:hypothetical protein